MYFNFLHLIKKKKEKSLTRVKKGNFVNIHLQKHTMYACPQIQWSYSFGDSVKFQNVQNRQKYTLEISPKIMIHLLLNLRKKTWALSNIVIINMYRQHSIENPYRHKRHTKTVNDCAHTRTHVFHGHKATEGLTFHHLRHYSPIWLQLPFFVSVEVMI